MKRVLLTGMSATGKSTLIAEVRRLGYRAVDMDEPGWSEPRAAMTSAGEPFEEWVWQEDRVRDLLASVDGEALFVSGCASNQGKFYDRFDHIVLLTAPASLIVDRLATRTNNPFGKRPEELARVLDDLEVIEPTLRRGATLELDTSVSVDLLVEQLLRLVT